MFRKLKPRLGREGGIIPAVYALMVAGSLTSIPVGYVAGCHLLTGKLIC